MHVVVRLFKHFLPSFFICSKKEGRNWLRRVSCKKSRQHCHSIGCVWLQCRRLTEATARYSEWGWPTCKTCWPFVVGHGARLSVSQDSEEWRRQLHSFSHDWLICGDCGRGSGHCWLNGLRQTMDRLTVSLSVDCWLTDTDLLLLLLWSHSAFTLHTQTVYPLDSK